ncbi:MAG: patatin-like phospholipase family protein [Burkholderiaceae bacterium]
MKSQSRKRSHRPRVGLALAGGGPLGAIYEIGALAALDEALHGVDVNDAEVYVGVSAGSFIAAALINGFTPREMSRLFVEGEQSDSRFDPAMLLRPDYRELAQRLASVPALLASSLWSYARRTSTLTSALDRLKRAIPTGIFSGHDAEQYLRRVFSAPGRTNDFRELPRKLYVVATDLDTGRSVPFGAPGLDHVPISRAVQASAALPGLFAPVEIDGRHFVDGALQKTLHASVALDHGVDLLICINSLVPFDATLDRRHRLDRLADGGLPAVLGQTFRSLIHSRLASGLERYKAAYPASDIVLFEPDRADADIFFSNLFSYSNRQRLAEHAYQRTRADLWRRRHELGPLLQRHGVQIRSDVLCDSSLTLVESVKRNRGTGRERWGAAATRSLAHTLDDLERWMEAHGSSVQRVAPAQ